MSSNSLWVFDHTSASGSRQGGDPAFHAFEHNLETFTREVLQNSSDQRIQDLPKPVEVHFEFIELSGKDLSQFKQHVNWSNLKAHLESVGNSNSIEELTWFVNEIDSNGHLLLLKISDFHTQGLEGSESGEDSNFTALCKDKLYSHKDIDSAGGTYGLGKSVLWGFSGISTVLFNSYIYRGEGKGDSPRIIGRAELPSHQIDGEWFTGSGWFGKPKENERGKRAESVWREEAENLERKVVLGREADYGTTILILGFMDPTSSEEEAIENYLNQIEKAGVKFFWPSMLQGDKKLVVTSQVEGSTNEANPYRDPDILPFLKCYEDYLKSSYKEELDEPGDIVCKKIPVEIPDKKNGSKTKDGSVALCVQLAKETSTLKLLNNIAYFRGSQMVTKYRTKRTSLSARPFHAIVIAGVARSPDSPTKADKDLEEFLRAAEPPAHGDWKSTSKLKDKYERGYAKAISELKEGVNSELVKLIRPKLEHGEEGPDRLRKRFKLFKKGSGRQGSGGPERPREKISVERFNSSFDPEENRWIIDGSVSLDGISTDHGDWKIKIAAFSLGEDGSRQQHIPFNYLETDREEVSTKEDERYFVITIDRDIYNIDLTLETQPVIKKGAEAQEEVGELFVDLKGEVFEGD